LPLMFVPPTLAVRVIAAPLAAGLAELESVVDVTACPVPALPLLKIAVMAEGLFRAKAQVLVPVQAMSPEPPLQPTKVDPFAGAAVNTIEVPILNDALQVEPQLIPAGDEVTVPLPLPALVTVTVGTPGSENTAFTVEACANVTVQLPMPLQVALPVGLVHPVKTEPCPGTAFKTTTVPEL